VLGGGLQPGGGAVVGHGGVKSAVSREQRGGALSQQRGDGGHVAGEQSATSWTQHVEKCSKNKLDL